MSHDQNYPNKIISSWRYYSFENIENEDKCQAIAEKCHFEATLSRIISILCAVMGFTTLYFTQWMVKGIFYPLIDHEFVLLGLITAPPLLAIFSFPFLALAIASARYWSYANHLDQQADQAQSRKIELKNRLLEQWKMG